jgi:hypothetical protein
MIFENKANVTDLISTSKVMILKPLCWWFIRIGAGSASRIQDHVNTKTS